MSTLLNTRILASLGMIVFVAAVWASATGAFFSDTETSTGNTFTAGDVTIGIVNLAHEYMGDGVAPDVPTFTQNGFTFGLGDLKPLDEGAITYGLDNGSNDAYFCAAVEETDNADNGRNDPETDAGDTTDDTGELGNFLSFSFGSATGTLAAVSGQWFDLGVIDGDATASSSINYCFGTYVGGVCTNSSTSTVNQAQTDSLTANVHFYAVQTRNNPGFSCEDLDPIGGGDDDVVVAATYATGFEPGDSFALGNINGQSGWIKSGPYDAEIENDPVISDTQSFRISNAVTSGSFGDQTFSQSLSDEAGETGATSSPLSGGTRQNHFEAQFDFKSASTSHQPGLFLSVSPDRGDGARMSYLGFEDTPGGIDVIFYDVQGTGNPANFVSTTVANDLDRTVTHTAKIVMDFVDGPSNDVVKVYINGSLVHTGTSWENYFRFDDESNPSLDVNYVPTVDSLLFRAGGTAAPATMGAGFLIDSLTLSSGTL